MHGRHHPGMQLAPRVPSRQRARRASFSFPKPVGPVVAGAAWLALAGITAWVVAATPLLVGLATAGAHGTAMPVVGAIGWAIALTAPACFTILGVARLAAAVNQARGARPPAPPVARRAKLLPRGCSVIPRVVLPDGAAIPDVVVGPHGVAFFEELPPRAAVRRTCGRWEVRFVDRSWRPIEDPLARAARDAERLRRHLAAGDRDFLVRVRAAVLGDPADVERADGCAVVALEEVPAWLAALPAQRGLTPDRLEHLRAVLASLA